MGSDVTKNGLRFQLDDRIKPLGKKQLEMANSDLDPKHIDVNNLYSAKGSKGGRSQAHNFHVFLVKHYTISLQHTF